MMSKYFFVFILVSILMVNYANAQTFGVRAGLNYSNVLSRKDYYTDETTVMKFGYQLGTIANYSVSDKFSIEPGLLFSTLGNKKQWTYDFEHESVESTYYIQIPIHAQYKLGTVFLLHAGPYFGFAVGGNTIYKTFEDGKKIYSWNYLTFFDYHRRYSDGVLRTGYNPINRVFDCGFGVGVAVKLNNIRVGFEGNIGIIRENDKFAHDGIYSYHRNVWLALTATYMFGK